MQQNSPPAVVGAHYVADFNSVRMIVKVVTREPVGVEIIGSNQKYTEQHICLRLLRRIKI